MKRQNRLASLGALTGMYFLPSQFPETLLGVISGRRIKCSETVWASVVMIPFLPELELHILWKEPEFELLEFRNRFYYWWQCDLTVKTKRIYWDTFAEHMKTRRRHECEYPQHITVFISHVLTNQPLVIPHTLALLRRVCSLFPPPYLALKPYWESGFSGAISAA